MRLLIDMDSVLVDLLTPWLAKYNRDYDDALSPEDITDWDTSKFVKPECGKDVFRYLIEPGLFRSLKPLPNAVDCLKSLMDKGHEVYIVTASPVNNPTAAWEKRESIREHFPFFPQKNVVFCHPKHIIHGDILFDDSPLNLEKFSRIGVAMAYPYNVNKGTMQVSSWTEFESLVDRLEKTEDGTIRFKCGRVLYKDGQLVSN